VVVLLYGREMARLGDHELIKHWSQRNNRWGPDQRWSAWFGGGVVDALIETLDLHLNTPSEIGSRYAPKPAVLGAVPWMTHADVIDRLTYFEACVVIAKLESHHRRKIVEYANSGRPFPKQALGALDDWGSKTADGKPPLITPGAPYPAPSEPLGPVRVLGYRGDKQPILHTKLLVLGVTFWLENDEFPEERLWFRPQRVWWGSANLTTFSQSHLEMGTLSDDPDLVKHAFDYVVDLIRLSEPFDSVTFWPTPDLTEGTWDDEAFWQVWEDRHDGDPETG
jgi:hypothetical protein